MPPAAIVAEGLSKTYRTYRKRQGLAGALRGLISREYAEVHAARNVSFSIGEGELVGFLGPNGAGKTTVLKMLSGLLVPSAGTARVLGFVPWQRKTAFKRQLSLVLGQKNALWWDLPARESLELNRAIYQIPESQYRATVEELVDLLEVRDKLGTMVRELSLGERMKMELIAALLHQPKVLFLDEPTIGLDVISQQKVREFLRFYNEKNRTSMMLTSHYMQDIEELCPRVIVIDHGQVFFDGAFAEILERYGGVKYLRFTFAVPPKRLPAGVQRIEGGSGNELRLKVPRDRVADVCREILGENAVHDFSVEEEPIEDIIRQLFRERSAGAAAQDDLRVTSSA
ncbi:MAG: ATP-binding cassette domain-containing protein [Verrucomicrobia bacterium]|nr:ATP-binding cassette domain-containing protein [Verrucomicrobiota bacterium]